MCKKTVNYIFSVQSICISRLLTCEKFVFSQKIFYNILNIFLIFLDSKKPP